jgi:hypothetical protein
MASTGGLTRRRGGGGGGNTVAVDDGERSTSPATPRPRDGGVSGGDTAYTTENGHKIGEYFCLLGLSPISFWNEGECVYVFLC